MSHSLSSRDFSTPTGSRCCLVNSVFHVLLFNGSTHSQRAPHLSERELCPQRLEQPVSLDTFPWRSLAMSSPSVCGGSLAAASDWSNDVALQQRNTSCSLSNSSASSPTCHTQRCSTPAARKRSCVFPPTCTPSKRAASTTSGLCQLSRTPKKFQTICNGFELHACLQLFAASSHNILDLLISTGEASAHITGTDATLW